MVRYILKIMIINPSKKRDYVMVKADKLAFWKSIARRKQKNLLYGAIVRDLHTARRKGGQNDHGHLHLNQVLQDMRLMS